MKAIDKLSRSSYSHESELTESIMDYYPYEVRSHSISSLPRPSTTRKQRSLSSIKNLIERVTKHQKQWMDKSTFKPIIEVSSGEEVSECTTLENEDTTVSQAQTYLNVAQLQSENNTKKFKDLCENFGDIYDNKSGRRTPRLSVVDMGGNFMLDFENETEKVLENGFYLDVTTDNVPTGRISIHFDLNGRASFQSPLPESMQDINFKERLMSLTTQLNLFLNANQEDKNIITSFFPELSDENKKEIIEVPLKSPPVQYKISNTLKSTTTLVSTTSAILNQHRYSDSFKYLPLNRDPEPPKLRKKTSNSNLKWSTDHTKKGSILRLGYSLDVYDCNSSSGDSTNISFNSLHVHNSKLPSINQPGVPPQIISINDSNTILDKESLVQEPDELDSISTGSPIPSPTLDREDTLVVNQKIKDTLSKLTGNTLISEETSNSCFSPPLLEKEGTLVANTNTHSFIKPLTQESPVKLQSRARTLSRTISQAFLRRLRA